MRCYDGSRRMSSTDDLREAVLRPQWPAPANVHALSTLRAGGVSRGPWGLVGGGPGGLNLGERCGDAHACVRENRRRLRALLPSEPLWLDQVHGTEVVEADTLVARSGPPPRADAAIATRGGVVLAVLTADCLPVLLTNASGSAVGVAHAGWRGLAAGVVESTLAALARASTDRRWFAWLGPAIGPSRFEVGAEVRRAFVDQDAAAARAFVPAGPPDKWWADLFALARLRLARAGVIDVYGGGICTASQPDRFYSYRRDRTTGRMASLIWLG